MSTDHHLTVEPQVVVASGNQTAGMSGSWQEWAAAAATTFGDAGDATRNGTLGAAMSTYASRWNPSLSGLASEVDTLGGNVTTAGTVVDHADLVSTHLLVNQHQAADEQTTLMTRQINVV